MLKMITTIKNKKNCRAFLKKDPPCGDNHNAHNHHKKVLQIFSKNDPFCDNYHNAHNDHNHHK